MERSEKERLGIKRKAKKADLDIQIRGSDKDLGGNSGEGPHKRRMTLPTMSNPKRRRDPVQKQPTVVEKKNKPSPKAQQVQPPKPLAKASVAMQPTPTVTTGQ